MVPSVPICNLMCTSSSVWTVNACGSAHVHFGWMNTLTSCVILCMFMFQFWMLLTQLKKNMFLKIEALIFFSFTWVRMISKTNFAILCIESLTYVLCISTKFLQKNLSNEQNMFFRFLLFEKETPTLTFLKRNFVDNILGL